VDPLLLALLSIELGLESTSNPWHNARLPPPVDLFERYWSQQ